MPAWLSAFSVQPTNVSRSISRYVSLALVCVIATSDCRADDPKPQAAEIVIREGLAIGGLGSRGRVSLPVDPVERTWVRGAWQSPQAGDTVTLSDGSTRTWEAIKASDDGSFSGRTLMGGALMAKVNVPESKVWLLESQGNSVTRINGQTRMGDVYSNGMLELPVELQAGENELMFFGPRGGIRAKLVEPAQPIYLSQRDTTYPTPVRGEADMLWGALLVVNATTKTQTGLSIMTSGEWLESTSTPINALIPLSTTKVPFQVQLKDGFPAGEIKLAVEMRDANNETISKQDIAWNAVEPSDLIRRTFISEIDGSVQYYAVRPKSTSSTQDQAPDMILSLHGAGVEGQGQAACYEPKENMIIVSPTNRRAFGFDWEDWGRMDAVEVLNLASVRYGTNPLRTYLSGHSMGGHGTWHIGSLFPSRFAAIAPSAGWISFATYAGGRPKPNDNPLDQMMASATLPSDTLTRLPNLASQGIYILHGDRDDNVPVDQARTMREELSRFHPDFVYKEQPGAGHWWGNQCVDWPPLVRFLRDHSLAEYKDVNTIQFVTPNPAISNQHHWATIYSQSESGKLSSLDLTLDRNARKLVGKSSNIAVLMLDLSHLAPADGQSNAMTIELDDTKLESIALPESGKLWLARATGDWQVSTEPTKSAKGPHRCGPFKEAFQHRFVLVYGTHGSPDENAWMLDKARYDAEAFRYRGNASPWVISDKDFEASELANRNVIVYGNASINSAWQTLLASSPIQVESNKVAAGEFQAANESLCTLFVRPKQSSDTNMVAAIGGTDLEAMRATTRLPIFSSGTGFPDAMIVPPDFLAKGNAAIRMAGYFGNDWSIEQGVWVKP